MNLTKFRTTRLSAALGARLKHYARENELAESAVMRLALQQFLPRYRKDELALDEPIVNEANVGDEQVQGEERSSL